MFYHIACSEMKWALFSLPCRDQSINFRFALKNRILELIVLYNWMFKPVVSACQAGSVHFVDEQSLGFKWLTFHPGQPWIFILFMLCVCQMISYKITWRSLPFYLIGIIIMCKRVYNISHKLVMEAISVNKLSDYIRNGWFHSCTCSQKSFNTEGIIFI